MSTLSSQKQLVRFEETTPFTVAVAMLSKQPDDFIDHPDIVFQEGYDDLDYVFFSELLLPSDRQLALLYHKRSPVKGMELCVASGETSIIEIIVETIQFLKLSSQDILWIHPQFEKDLKDALIQVLDKSLSGQVDLNLEGDRSHMVMEQVHW